MPEAESPPYPPDKRNEGGRGFQPAINMIGPDGKPMRVPLPNYRGPVTKDGRRQIDVDAGEEREVVVAAQ